MCFERTRKRVEPFHVGYRLVFKKGNKYHGCCSSKATAVLMGEWVDEMPYRFETNLLEVKPKDLDGSPANVGWHVFSSIKQAKESDFYHDAIIRVECYGLAKPYGLGLAYGQPAGRFQFMKILEEVK